MSLSFHPPPGLAKLRESCFEGSLANDNNIKIKHSDPSSSTKGPTEKTRQKGAKSRKWGRLEKWRLPDMTGPLYSGVP